MAFLSFLRVRLVAHGTFRSSIAWLRGYLHALDRCRATGLAAELAFWMFLSLIPLAAVFGLVAARLAMNDMSLLIQMTSALPRASRDLLFGELSRVSAWNSGAVGPLAAVVFVWLGSSGIHAIFDAIELSSRAYPRTWVRKRLMSIATCLALSIGAALTLVMGVGLNAMGRLLHSHAPLLAAVPRVGWTVRAVGALGVSIAMVATLFAVGLPRARGKKMRVFPGAIMAVGAHVTMGFGYGLFVSKAGDGGAYQAGLAVIGVTLTALYLSSLALLMGATLNHYLTELYPPHALDASGIARVFSRSSSPRA